MEILNVVSAVDEEGMSPKSPKLRLLTLATSMDQFKSKVVEGIADLLVKPHRRQEPIWRSRRTNKVV